MRLLSSVVVDNPAENLLAIGRGELAKARSEEPWCWPDEFCLAADPAGPAVCAHPGGHRGPHSWQKPVRVWGSAPAHAAIRWAPCRTS